MASVKPPFHCVILVLKILTYRGGFLTPPRPSPKGEGVKLYFGDLRSPSPSKGVSPL